MNPIRLIAMAMPLLLAVTAHAQSGKIAFSSDRDGNSEIYVMSGSGSNVTRLTHDPAADFWPALSPDGSQIVFVSTRAGNDMRELFLMNADGTGLRRLTDSGERSPADRDVPPFTTGPESPAFHPRGDRIVFAQGELYIVSTNSGAVPQRVVIAGGTDITVKEEPVFSPDGTRIAFAGWTETETEPDSGIFILNSDIYAVNTNGAGLTRITTNAAWETAPSFSHDGARIVFTRQEDFSAGIYVVRSTGGAATPITSADFAYGAAAFSPDDSRIVFDAADDTSFFHIYSISTNRTGLVRLSQAPTADHRDPSWAMGVVQPTLHVSIANPRVPEGNSGTTEVLATVSLSSPAANVVSVTLSTVDDSALAGQDYVAANHTIEFAPGQVSRTASVAIIGDSAHEIAEQFFVELSAAQNASISTPRATVTIANDDPIPFLPGRLAFISYSNGNSDIFLMNPDRSATYNLTDTPNVEETAPVWSPDGATIAFVSTDETNFFRDIFLINADGTGRRNLTNTPERDEYNPSWSPDGTQLVFESSDEEFNFELFIISAAGGRSRMLTNALSWWPMPHRDPVWSVDGKIYFAQTSNSVWSLRSVDSDGRNERVLTTATSEFADTRISKPAVSPEGSKIVFMQAFGEGFDVQSDIMLINRDGTGLTNLTAHPAEDVDPTFTPDGTRVMFSSTRDATFDLYTVPVPTAAASRTLAASAVAPADRWTSGSGDELDADWDRTTIANPGLRISSTGSSINLHFPAAANRSYTVQYSTDLLGGSWRNLANVAAQATAREVSVSDAITAPPAHRFYRVMSP